MRRLFCFFFSFLLLSAVHAADIRSFDHSFGFLAVVFE